MKTLLIIVLIYFSGCKVYGQPNPKVWKEKQPLQWFDFGGRIIDTSDYDAESFAEVRYNYTWDVQKGFYFEVSASFNTNTSWCRKEYQSEALLKHEQLHFDIAELYARKIKRAFENHQYGADFRNEIVDIFNEMTLEYHAMQHSYDEETRHSLNRERQRDWENLVFEGLGQAKSNIGYAKK